LGAIGDTAVPAFTVSQMQGYPLFVFHSAQQDETVTFEVAQSVTVGASWREPTLFNS
jgi:molybdopterin biosynthesis enzyme